MELYNARANGLTDNERSKLVFLEVKSLEDEVAKKSIRTSRKSSIFWWINTLLNLIVIVSSGTIVIIMGINNFQNIPAIVLGGLIFVISGCNELLKLGSKGYYYRQGTYRLRRIRQQTRDLIYMFHNYTIEQILAFISSLRTEIDEIDMELYKSSMIGDAKFGNGLRIINEPARVTPTYQNSQNSYHSQNSEQNNSTPGTPSHIHIHIDSGNSSPTDSPRSDSKSTSRPPSRNLSMVEPLRLSLPNIKFEPDNRDTVIEIEEPIVNL